MVTLYQCKLVYNHRNGKENWRRHSKSDLRNGCNRIQTILSCCGACKDHLSKRNGDRTEQAVQMAKKERLSGDKRRILQSAHTMLYRIRVVWDQEKSYNETKRKNDNRIDPYGNSGRTTAYLEQVSGILFQDVVIFP